jgi:hypothetical protein
MRDLNVIAFEIFPAWPKVSQSPAYPYAIGLCSVAAPGDRYGCETGRDLVQGFLSNAGTWHGEKAKAVKTELRKILQG